MRNDDDCTELCLIARCGDGFLDPEDEECDDGNLQNGDGCSSICIDETCAGFVAELGDNRRRVGLDLDVYKFDGVVDEEVALSLSPAFGVPSGTATLVLVDDDGGKVLYASVTSEMPIEITGEVLEQDGTYSVIVRAHSNYSEGTAFRGNYCIELKLDGENASDALGGTPPWDEIE
jgi:cysteine-rich repeat protein